MLMEQQQDIFRLKVLVQYKGGSMSGTNLVQASTRHYKISDAWLDLYHNDKNRYVDIDEIRKNPSASQYLQDLIAMGIITEADLIVHQKRASFIDNGFVVGYIHDDDDDTDYLTVRGEMAEDHYVDTMQLLPTYAYSYVYKRIYAHGTAARDITFLGVLSKTYDGTDNRTISNTGIPGR